MTKKVITIDVEKTTGTLDTRSVSEINAEANNLDYAMDLGLIGSFDDSMSETQRQDISKALRYIDKGESIPEELLKRLLRYKEKYCK